MEQRTHDRKAPSKDSFDTRTPQVESWIAGLPLANIGETSRRIYGALTETNQLAVPADQRLRMLELLREPLASVDEAMRKHFVGRQFPLPDKSRQIAHLAQSLLGQMAYAYEIVVEDSRQRRGLLGDNRQAVTATHRALAYLGDMLLRAYQVYAPYPPGAWHQVHALYQNAEQQGFAKSSVKDDVNDDVPATIEDVYKRILLLALSCPYRLRQGEVEKVYEWLGEWAHFATLEPMGPTNNATGLFVTHFGTDNPPTYLILRSEDYPPELCRLLNATRLADVMRDALARQRREEGGTSHAVNDHVLRRLMLAWGVMPKRRFSRSQKQSSAMVAMGLSAAHYFISGEVAFSAGTAPGGSEPLFKSAARFEAGDVSEQKGHTPDLWEMGGARPQHETHQDAAGNQYIDFHSPEPRQAAAIPSSLAPSYRTFEWTMVNVSAGGYRLLWNRDEGSQAQVGELIGLRESDDPDSFHLGLGVVRWMKCDSGKGLELGVEMLSPGAVAVGTRILKNKGGSDYMRSLLLPSIEAIGQPATLLTPALPYHVGDTVSVNSHGKEVQVELTKVVENTGTFAQFQFRALDSQGAIRTDRASPKDFEAVWAAI